MGSFDLLTSAGNASESIEKARDFIRGGQMTDIFEQMGDVHLRSAIEHVRQAEHSSDPASRLTQATGDLQNAYLLFARAAAAGPSRKLRILLDMSKLEKARAQATDCAAAISLIQWTLGEAVPNRRLWLDRASRQIAMYNDEMRQGWKMTSAQRYVCGQNSLPYEALRQIEVNTLPPSAHRAALLKYETADRYRRPSDDVKYIPRVVLARHYFEQELRQPWTDPLR